MIVRMKSYRSELESAISLLGLILLMSTSAIVKELGTLFLVFGVVVVQPGKNLIYDIMISINYFILFILAYSNSHFLQLRAK